MYCYDYNIDYEKELEEIMQVKQNKIGTATVVTEILPKGKVIPNTTINPTSITIHQTGNVGASAVNNHNYMKNCNKNGDRIASWHFTVDDKFIYQAVDTNKMAYHAGCSQGNKTSIGIEICMFNDPAQQLKAYKNAIELVKILMTNHGFNINQVKRHYDWTKKHCPAWLIENKYGYNWAWFKGQISNNSVTSVNNLTGLVKINTASLNVRSGPGTNYKVVTTVKQGEVFTITQTQGNWGKLKSGAGWINLKYTLNV